MDDLVILVKDVVADIKKLSQSCKVGDPNFEELIIPAGKAVKSLIEIFTDSSKEAGAVIPKVWIDFITSAKNLYTTTSALRREGDGQEDDEELEKEKKELPSKIDEMEKAMNKLAGEIKRFVLIQREMELQRQTLQTKPQEKLEEKQAPQVSPETNEPKNRPPIPPKPADLKRISTDDEDEKKTKRDTRTMLSLLINKRPTQQELIKRHILQGTVAETTDTEEKKPTQNWKRATKRILSTDLTPFIGSLVKGEGTPVALVKGEEVLIKVDDVYYRHTTVNHVTWRSGKIIITNFQLMFIRDSDDVLLTTVPLALIAGVEKVGGDRSLDELTGATSSHKLVIECKDFYKLHFNFDKSKRPKIRGQLYKMIKSLITQPPNQTFAFHFRDTFLQNGWDVYNPEKEYERMGVTASNMWRIATSNKSYKLCATYPGIFCVPAKVYDPELVQVAEFRSKGRVQALAWLNRFNSASITRCSQPRVGITRRRCSEDEQCITQILTTNKFSGGFLHIIDARPRVNARANQAKGAGTENTNNYKNCKISFADIGNIHVMRDSLSKVNDAVYLDDESKFFAALDSSQFTAGNSQTSCYVDRINSDGWDRTPQLTGLAMLLLDPYYRTIIGFEVLIEKEWVSFGHQFALRTGSYYQQMKVTIKGNDGQNNFHERSPIFLQWIDCVFQIYSQNPSIFEFNEKFLITILEESYSCKFGTFLYNCEKERKENEVKEKTHSLWSYINSNINNFKNPLYMPFDDHYLPVVSLKKLRLWENFYFRRIPEMLNPPIDVTVGSVLNSYESRVKQ